jgi:hypothetical protein
MSNQASLFEIKLRDLHVLNENASVEMFKNVIAPRLDDVNAVQFTFTSQYTEAWISGIGMS